MLGALFYKLFERCWSKGKFCAIPVDAKKAYVWTREMCWEPYFRFFFKGAGARVNFVRFKWTLRRTECTSDVRTLGPWVLIFLSFNIVYRFFCRFSGGHNLPQTPPLTGASIKEQNLLIQLSIGGSKICKGRASCTEKAPSLTHQSWENEKSSPNFCGI